MTGGGEKNGDFYAVLGLKKECSDSELRNAYKKLALRWHPDRCSALGNSEFVKEAKEKFQAIQEAYSILSDSNKRFMYDVGVYDSDDDENEMGDFLDEMVQMMSQTKPTGNGQDSFQDLQQLFVDMFQADLDLSGLGGGPVPVAHTVSSSSNACFNPSASDCGGGGGKRRGPALSSASGKAKVEGLDSGYPAFCFGVLLVVHGKISSALITIEGVIRYLPDLCYKLESSESMQPVGSRGSSRRPGRKQKASSKQDLSKDTGISA